MTDRADLIIRGGTIVDGTGGVPFVGDVAIDHGLIAAVGSIDATGVEEIDARNHLVTPGFIDIHTHYDGQVTWENRLSPSSGHGVTTVVMGNCGVGFAPCRPADRQRLVRLMEGVEDLPEIVLTAGLPWDWQTFPEYMDRLAARSFDIDIAAQIPHAALRVFAMGERASEREDATAQDRAAMAQLAIEAMAAGALGFATSRTINHRASDGTLIPTLTAGEQELTAIADALGATGRGVLQVVSDFTDVDAELALLRRVAEHSKRPLSVSLMQWHHAPEKWRTILTWIETCNADGLEVRGQVSGRPIGMLLGFECSYNPFSFTPTFKSLTGLSPSDRLQALHRPEIRDQVITETPQPSDFPGQAFIRSFDKMYALGAEPNYEPLPTDTIAAQAKRAGVLAAELAYDLMLERGGQGMLMLPSVNFADGTLNAAQEMLRHPHTVYGLGDGGAHLGFLCDASLPTFMLQYWGRDRVRGERLPLQEVVAGLTSQPAAAVKLLDRGLIRVGYKADVNIIDFHGLNLESPRVAYDLPAGGRRVTQDAKGYIATIVSGVATYRDGISTGALPGKLVRGTQTNH